MRSSIGARPAWARSVLVVLLFSLWPHAHAADNDGPFEIDKRYTYDDHGIWSRKIQLGLQASLVLGLIGTALFEGSESRLGGTAWRGIDSMLLTAASTQILKVAFSRSRPSQSEDAGKFFQGKGNRSFPSGEVSNVAALVTPFALEYGREQPWMIAAATGLVVYDGAARMKTRGHWQSDVIAGAALGGGIGWYMHGRSESLVVSALPGGVFVGFNKRF